MIDPFVILFLILVLVALTVIIIRVIKYYTEESEESIEEEYTIRENLTPPTNIQMNLGSGSLDADTINGGFISAGNITVSGKVVANGGIQIKQVNGAHFTHEGSYKYGDWYHDRCPENQYVCGIDSRLEKNQKDGDDGGMTGIRFHCCKFDTL
jgi:hypothetical protein